MCYLQDVSLVRGFGSGNRIGDTVSKRKPMGYNMLRYRSKSIFSDFETSKVQVFFLKISEIMVDLYLTLQSHSAP